MREIRPAAKKDNEPVVRKDSAQFAAVCDELFQLGLRLRFTAQGESMQPNILPGDQVVVEAAREGNVARGEVVLARGGEGFRVHRLIRKIAGGAAVTRGDAGQAEDAAEQEILGRVVAVVRRDEENSLEGPWSRPVQGARTFLRRVWLGGRRRLTGGFLGILPVIILWQLFAGAAPVRANNVPITVTQTPSVTTVSPGGQVTFTDVMMNTNNTASSKTPVFTQPIPTNTTYVSFVGPAGFTCSSGAVGGTTSVACTGPGGFPANGTATLTVTVQVALGTAGQTVLNANNTPTVTPGSGFTVTNVFTNTVTVISADLGLTQLAAPAMSAPSGSITFTNTITNINDATGGSTAAAPVLTFATPANTTFTSASGTGYTCSGLAAGGTGTETCTASGPLAISGTATITIVVAVNAGVANGTAIMGSATVSSTTYDPNLVNNTGTSTSTVTIADLALTQVAAPTSVAPGATITYTNVITNNGPATAAAPVLTFATPANTTFASATGTGYTCAGLAAGGTGTETCTATGALANAGTSTITIVVNVNAAVALGTVITGTGTVSSTTYDPNAANNTASSMATVAGADLTMSQMTSVSVVDTAVNFTYTEIATNNGPATVPAGTLVVYQQTPPNTTLQSIAVDTNWTCSNPAAGGTGPIVCTYALALAGGSTTAADPITFVLSVNNGTAYGTTILNSATVTSQTIDPVPSNNTSITTVLVEPAAQADLTIAMDASPTPAFLFSTLAYTMQVENLGQASAAAVTVTDTIPAGTTFLGVRAPAGWTCTESTPPPTPITVTCALTGAMAEGASAMIILSVTTPSSAGPITNTAKVSSTTPDPVAANNSATVITVVQPLVCATPGKDGAGGSLSGVVNTYYPGTGTLTAGATPTVTLGASSGAATTIGVGDLLLIMQMQDSLINSTNTSSYGDGLPGDPATGSVNQQNSGQFEYVTATSAVGAGGGVLTFKGTGANGGTLNTYTEAGDSVTQGQQTYQVIRVPQYTSATLSSGLVPLAWNGSVGGVLAIDVASQLTLGGNVAADALGFRGGGGITLASAAAGVNTDYVTASPAALPALSATQLDPPAGSGVNASKGEGTAGTPHWVAPALATIINSSTATNTNQSSLEGLPGGSFARGAPGNAGGGGTDGDSPKNDKNSGGGAGGNGGTGGLGGYGWNSFTALNSTDGGFGGTAFPASTSAIVMGGGGGAGTTNNGSYYVAGVGSGADCGATCTGVFSSGGFGGGIIIVHTGSVSGTGTITANGQTTLNTLNDSTGGGGAGGSIIFFANSGSLAGLTVNASGGNGGLAWSTQAPTTFPGNRHGSGGGGGGGVIFLSGTPGSLNVSGGANGYTNTVQDSYGATPGATGVSATNLVITETPGTQSGAYCAGADVSVTNAAAPNPIAAGSNITYTQVVSNVGPQDALNAVFSEAVPVNTTFQSISAPAGWSCNSNASILSTGAINCTNADMPSGAGGTGTFTVATQVNAGTAFGTQIVDTANITSGTNDPNLANNSATATTVVGTASSAYLTLTKTAAPTVVAGSNITYTLVMTNNGPAAAAPVGMYDTVPTNTTFVSVGAAGWSCSAPPVGGTGNIACTLASLASGASATFTLVVNVPSTGVANGTTISNTANANSAIPNPNPTAASATANVIVASATQADLAVTSAASPNPVLGGNNVTFTEVVINNGPATVSASFTDAVPTGINGNTTFVSLATPSGWSCTTPAAGTTGTITCTNATFAPGGTATFPIVVQTSATNPPGTVITNTANIGPTASDPYLANNTATSMTTVTSATQADVSIVKTASPEPVDQNTNLTYTLQVTNNGPAIAQGVAVSDPLPSAVTFTNVSTTQGTCTQSGGTMNCTIGTMSVGEQVLITINVNAATYSSGGIPCNTVNGIPYTVCNTATVTATTGDPNSANNSSEADSTIQSPTAVQLSSFRAMARPEGGVLLEWHTQEEIRNLGFNVYREDAQGRHRVNPSIIAGAALLIRGGRPQHGAKTYRWIDPQGNAASSYVLEDVDLNGTRTSHGPASPEAQETALIKTVADVQQAKPAVTNAVLLTQLNQVMTKPVAAPQRVLKAPRPPAPKITLGQYREALDLVTALKIGVQSEGWYHVSRQQMIDAGFNPGWEPQFLQLYAEGVEQPLLVRIKHGPEFGFLDGIEFYGTGIDTPFSDTRVYWLIRGTRPGKHIAQIPAASSGASSAQSFLATVVREDRTTYFATLLNGEDLDNFFGDAVTSEPVDETLTVAHSDANSSLPTSVDITLQGATDQQAHRVSVAFNGAPIGEMDFNNQANVTNTFAINSSLLRDGVNAVTLTALEGDNDVSVVQSVQLHYPHLYAADGDWLKAGAPAGASLQVSGFTSGQIYAADITDPEAVTMLSGAVTAEGSSYAISVAVPNAGAAERTLVFFTGEQISAPSSLTLHAPDTTLQRPPRAGLVIISHPEFVASLAPLVALHESQGHAVTTITTDQLYDAFNYGERTPYALRDYLQQLAAQPTRKPEAVLLVGDASLDPRNYLGFGNFDFVPTRIIETQAFKTASDDWLSDFAQTGFATIPTGRLPVRTVAEAALVISKIVTYESGSSAGPWTKQALLIADQNVDVNFTNEADFAATNIPTSLTTKKIYADGLDVNTARQQILDALNNGALLVNYTGHGAEEQWSFSDLFDDGTAAALTNGDRLPFFLLMDCLNGFFQDVYTQSLAESLLLAPNGGAVAVWASSGFTNAPGQGTMDQALLGLLKGNPALPLGQGALRAKAGVTDADVRRTWILFGDPLMQLQMEAAPAAAANVRRGISK